MKNIKNYIFFIISLILFTCDPSIDGRVNTKLLIVFCLILLCLHHFATKKPVRIIEYVVMGVSSLSLIGISLFCYGIRLTYLNPSEIEMQLLGQFYPTAFINIVNPQSTTISTLMTFTTIIAVLAIISYLFGCFMLWKDHNKLNVET